SGTIGGIGEQPSKCGTEVIGGLLRQGVPQTGTGSPVDHQAPTFNWQQPKQDTGDWSLDQCSSSKQRSSNGTNISNSNDSKARRSTSELKQKRDRDGKGIERHVKIGESWWKTNRAARNHQYLFKTQKIGSQTCQQTK